MFVRSFVVPAICLMTLASPGWSEERPQLALDPRVYCEKNECYRGPSLKDPPIIDSEWVPFESSDLLVWGADVCLGYFLTNDESAWNGGVKNSVVDDHHGIYLQLGDLRARVNIMDYPFDIEGSPYRGFGVFHCQNTRWPEHSIEDVDTSEIRRWVDQRLTASGGWSGDMADWNSRDVGEFRNEDLGLTINIRKVSEGVNIRFAADYFGPPIIFGFPISELY